MCIRDRGCDTTEPAKDINIFLREVDVSVKEAYLHLSFESIKKRKLTLIRNGNLISEFSCSKLDTIITDTSLVSNTNYIYKVQEGFDDYILAESNELPILTFEPTSHDISWEIYSFDEQINGIFWDIAAVDINNLWAVGEVYLLDSLGNYDNEPYGAAHWNGENWQFQKVSYRRYGTAGIIRPGAIRASYVVDEELYVASSAVLLSYNENQWVERAFFIKDLPFGQQINKIWAEDSENIFLGANNGTVFNVTSNGWRIIVSNSTQTIHDLWGYPDIVENNIHVIGAVSVDDNIFEGRLIKILDEENILDINLPTDRTTVSSWTNRGTPIYTCGDGIFSNRFGGWGEISLNTNVFSNNIRGTSLNDIFVVGDFGLIAHFNGINWKNYNLPIAGNYKSLVIKENIIAIAGNYNGKAIVVIGERM
jgi:hypothetical protein